MDFPFQTSLPCLLMWQGRGWGSSHASLAPRSGRQILMILTCAVCWALLSPATSFIPMKIFGNCQPATRGASVFCLSGPSFLFKVLKSLISQPYYKYSSWNQRHQPPSFGFGCFFVLPPCPTLGRMDGLCEDVPFLFSQSSKFTI